VAHDDLLAGADASQEVREEVTRVSGVVLGELAWRGAARRLGLAKPAEKSLKHT